MQHNETNWQSKDGLKLFAQSWIPDDGPRAAFCLVHGLGEHSGRYVELVASLVENGFAVFSFDLRGHGRSEGQRGHAPDFNSFMDDIDLLVSYAAEQYPDKPSFIYGHSLGGLLVLNYALRRTPDVSGVISSSPGLRSELTDQKLKVNLSKVLGSVWPTLSLPSGLDASKISRDPMVVEAYRNDPLVSDQVSVGFAKGSIEAIDWVYDHASEFSLPLLLMHGTADELCYAHGTEEFCDRVPSNCTLKLWDGYFHELHHEPGKEQVFEYLLNWMEDIIQVSSA
jgi:alpha-beta hydrolase superfamily lysophospholipase